eukprot:31408-Pelagococcus_subviridis.AAC.7
MSSSIIDAMIFSSKSALASNARPLAPPTSTSRLRNPPPGPRRPPAFTFSGTGEPSTRVALATPTFATHPLAFRIAVNSSSSSPGATLNACSNLRLRANALRSLAPLNPRLRFLRWSRNWSLLHIHASLSFAYSMIVRSSLFAPSDPASLDTIFTFPASTRSMSLVLTHRFFPRYLTTSALSVARPPPSASALSVPTTYSLGTNATTS